MITASPDLRLDIKNSQHRLEPVAVAGAIEDYWLDCAGHAQARDRVRSIVIAGRVTDPQPFAL